jgi:hypothetical protein
LVVLVRDGGFGFALWLPAIQAIRGQHKYVVCQRKHCGFVKVGVGLLPSSALCSLKMVVRATILFAATCCGEFLVRGLVFVLMVGSFVNIQTLGGACRRSLIILYYNLVCVRITNR